jgi:hypothetical protein
MALLLLSTGYMSASAKVIDLQAYREWPESERDTAINALWDQLVTAAEGAWTWRDAESVAALEQCVEALKRTVAEDWGTDVVRMAIR